MQTAKINNINEALAELGVTDKTLSPQEKQTIDEKGYIIIPAMLDKKKLEQFRAAFEKWSEFDKGSLNNKGEREHSTRHVDNLLNREPLFDFLYTHPKLLATAHHIFQRDFRLAGLGGRDPLPGFGLQGLHADWMPRTWNDPFSYVNSIWMLDDFTVENGATRIVPGSHQHIGPMPKSYAQPENKHPEQISAVGAAGSVLVFNGHIWHSGMRNNSKRSRRSVVCSFIGRELQQYLNQPSPETLERLTPAMRYIVGENQE